MPNPILFEELGDLPEADQHEEKFDFSSPDRRLPQGRWLDDR